MRWLQGAVVALFGGSALATANVAALQKGDRWQEELVPSTFQIGVFTLSAGLVQGEKPIITLLRLEVYQVLP